MCVQPMISAAVEGDIDEAVFFRLMQHVGAAPGHVYGRRGKAFLRNSVGGYNQAARHFPWFVLVDLNHEQGCGPLLRRTWLPEVARLMCFRVAVREVEAWLIADREQLARFLRVPRGRVPMQPETLDDPKDALIALARRSRNRAIREDLVPTPGGGRRVGPAYNSQLTQFVSSFWRPEIAANHAESLSRTLDGLVTLLDRIGNEDGQSTAGP